MKLKYLLLSFLLGNINLEASDDNALTVAASVAALSVGAYYLYKLGERIFSPSDEQILKEINLKIHEAQNLIAIKEPIIEDFDIKYDEQNYKQVARTLNNNEDFLNNLTPFCYDLKKECSELSKTNNELKSLLSTIRSRISANKNSNDEIDRVLQAGKTTVLKINFIYSILKIHTSYLLLNKMYGDLHSKYLSEIRIIDSNHTSNEKQRTIELITKSQQPQSIFPLIAHTTQIKTDIDAIKNIEKTANFSTYPYLKRQISLLQQWLESINLTIIQNPEFERQKEHALQKPKT